MREIKFRAWTGDKMISGDVDLDSDHSGPSNNTETISMSGLAQMYERKGWELMQFIGLQDKLGKDIYEDDLIKSPKGEIFRVMYDARMSQFVMEDLGRTAEDYSYPAGFAYTEAEVVGNFHQNKELLK